MSNYLCVLILAGFMALVGPVGLAHAEQNDMVQIVNSSSGDDESDTAWTAKKLEAVCKAKWKHQAYAIKNCIEGGQDKIGRPMNTADLQTLELTEPDHPPAARGETNRPGARKEAIKNAIRSRLNK
jgi:hypothetical protein